MQNGIDSTSCFSIQRTQVFSMLCTTVFVPALKRKAPDAIFHVDGAPASPHSFKKVKVPFRDDSTRTLENHPSLLFLVWSWKHSPWANEF